MVDVINEHVTINERTGLEMVQVSTWPATSDEVVRIVADLLGIAPPEMPNTVATRGDTRILWLGPERWLVVRPSMIDGVELEVALAQRLPPDKAAVVELGAGRRVFSISGARCRNVLAKELALDFDPSKLPAGRCVQSEMGHVGVLVHAVARDAIEIFVYRASAEHLREILSASTRN